MGKNGRIAFIDSLRWMATFFVVLCHWSNIFLREYFESKYADTLIQKIWIGSPFNIINNGNFSVCLFFILSGFLLTTKVYQTVDKGLSLQQKVNFTLWRRLKKVFELIVPGVLFGFLLMKMGWMYHLKAIEMDERLIFAADYYNFIPSVEILLKDLINSVVGTTSEFNGPLWTMKWELIGSMMIVPIAAYVYSSIQEKHGERRLIAYLLFSVPLMLVSRYMFCFTCGAMIEDLVKRSGYEEKFSGVLDTLEKNSTVKVIYLLVCVYLACTNVHASGIWFVFMPIKRIIHVFRIVGISGMLYFFMISNKAQKMLEKIAIPALTPYLSYIYIFHWPILCSLGCWIFVKGYGVMNRTLLIILVLVSCIVMTLIISFLYGIIYANVNQWIEKKKRA